MLTVKENTTIVGISELRMKIDEVLEAAKKHKVLIKRRNKPLAVLLDMERYNEIERVLDTLEDIALGYLAKEREAKSKPADYLDIAEAEKKIKLH